MDIPPLIGNYSAAPLHLFLRSLRGEPTYSSFSLYENESNKHSPPSCSVSYSSNNGPSSGRHSPPTTNPTIARLAPIPIRPTTASRLPSRPPLPSHNQQPALHPSQWSLPFTVPGHLSKRRLSDAYERERGRAGW